MAGWFDDFGRGFLAAKLSGVTQVAATRVWDGRGDRRLRRLRPSRPAGRGWDSVRIGKTHQATTRRAFDALIIRRSNRDASGAGKNDRVEGAAARGFRDKRHHCNERERGSEPCALGLPLPQPCPAPGRRLTANSRPTRSDAPLGVLT